MFSRLTFIICQKKNHDHPLGDFQGWDWPHRSLWAQAAVPGSSLPSSQSQKSSFTAVEGSFVDLRRRSNDLMLRNLDDMWRLESNKGQHRKKHIRYALKWYESWICNMTRLIIGSEVTTFDFEGRKVSNTSSTFSESLTQNRTLTSGTKDGKKLKWQFVANKTFGFRKSPPNKNLFTHSDVFILNEVHQRSPSSHTKTCPW